MKFVCYADWSQLPESANRLFDDSARQSVFFSRPWFDNLTRTVMEHDQSLLLACVVDGDRVLALLPLMTRGDQHLLALTHIYSSLYSLLLVENDQQAIVQCLVEGLDQMSIQSLRLGPVAEDDCNLQLLQKVMQSSGYECHRRFRFYNWIYRVQGRSFKDYMASRPSRVRNTLNRKRRKLEREHGYEIRMYTDRYLDTGLKDYDTVYRSSWKANELYEGFIEGLAHNLSLPGWLRLAVLYIEGKPAAAHFWFVVHGQASIFKLVYDESWKQYSPGSILISYLMEQVIDRDKVEIIDFLTGNDAYKQDWMSERRQRWSLSFFKQRSSKGIVERFFNPLKAMFLSN